MYENIKELQTWLNQQGDDLAYISDYHSIAYLTGFESDPIERILSLVVFPQTDPFIFAPALEVEAVKATGWPFDVYGYQDAQNPFELIGEHIKASSDHYHRWAVEKNVLTLKQAQALQTAIPEAIFADDVSQTIEQMRLIKTPAEIEKMHQAGADADRAFQYGFDALATHKTELAVMADLEYHLKTDGVAAMSFETLVQFGAHAANPHGSTGQTQLQPGDLALFDLGTVSDGYVSDSTRTVAFQSVSDHQRDIYQVVLEAQLTAQDAVKPGMTAGELDQIARDVITKAGYGEYFVHRLGHGIGSSVHESIQIAPNNDLVLRPGMAFSIEPGIYIPGDLGIRIEDSIVLTDEGADSFTHTTKELQIID
ncbi:Xaa-Pro dipeptidase [Weissella uvarum]|uniref:M24 family metallopeptidase n=1 Tax=Weissella uvarum TaxID=1479233 RepID=UPI00195FAEEF|nr:Xaa-Pro peptidase family protein [Weissella uvarum]MBM7617720.1 Xaa-Pro dipeptidase [Weissella uvarum]MCM0595901.1 aminopeptidase P family protein [Weissella uvarum]